MADDKTLASDDTHDSSLEATHQVQLVVNEVFERFAAAAGGVAPEDDEGAIAEVPEVKTALRDGLRAHGVAQQPEEWIDAAASEIAGGRRLVIDAREEVPPALGRPNGGRTSVDEEADIDRRESR